MPASISQKRNRTLIVLGLILIALLAIIQFSNDDAVEDNRKNFTTLTSDQVIHIAVNAHDKIKMVFEKSGQSWYLTEPFHRHADNSRIQVLLATLSLPKTNIYSSEDVNAKSMGLAPPAATLTMNDTDFLFGHKERNNNRRYLQTADKITLAADIVYPLFAQGVFGFIDKSLVPPGFINLETSTYTLSKTGNLWESSNGSSDDAESIVAAWLGQLSEEVVLWPLESQAPLQEAKKHTVKFGLEKGATLTLQIFEMKDVVLIHPEDSAYALAITPDQFASLKVDSN